MLHLSVHLLPTENPRTVGLAFWHANNGTLSIHLLSTESSMQWSQPSGTPTAMHISVHLPSTEIPMASSYFSVPYRMLNTVDPGFTYFLQEVQDR